MQRKRWGLLFDARLVGSALLAGSILLAPSPAAGEEPEGIQDASDTAKLRVRDGFDAADEESDESADLSFEQRFPDGKQSVVERQREATASLLTTAHAYALEGKEERAAYRDALLYQAASRLALADERFVEAMYLTFHARSIGRGVIRANTTRLPREYQPDNLELVRRAGKVEMSLVEEYLASAEQEVPGLDVLFVEGESDVYLGGQGTI